MTSLATPDLPSSLLDLTRPHPSAAEIEICDQLLDLLATPDQWCKGALEKDAAHCIYGGLNMVNHGSASWDDDYKPAVRRVEMALIESAQTPNSTGTGLSFSLVLFNNAPETKHADVIALLTSVRLAFLAES